jgi:hypothetical protein
MVQCSLFPFCLSFSSILIYSPLSFCKRKLYLKVMSTFSLLLYMRVTFVTAIGIPLLLILKQVHWLVLVDKNAWIDITSATTKNIPPRLLLRSLKLNYVRTKSGFVFRYINVAQVSDKMHLFCVFHVRALRNV